MAYKYRTTQTIKTNIAEVIKNKILRAKATFVINSDGCYWLYGNDRIKEEHFDLILPIKVQTIKSDKGENIGSANVL